MLHVAAASGYVGVVALLLVWGADTKLRNDNEKTALQYATDRCQADCEILLLQAIDCPLVVF